MTDSYLPKDFLWGFATASYQIEGAPTQDGRADSIWDTFCRIPGKIAGGANGDVACDSYNRTDEDIALLKETGAKSYRFSLSWSRIIPLGGRNDPVNEKGLQHYVKFARDLRAAGIEPLITLYHWDLPDNLDKRYGGLLNKDEFSQDFENYARVCFKAFGDVVKLWITFNEPWCSAVLGYSIGQFAPGRTSDRSKSDVGDSSTEPWIAGHAMLIAHAKAVKVYREEFKQKDGGQIGITLNGDWAMPWDENDPKDVEAANRKIEFAISWFGDAIYFGHYPESMRKQLGSRLPEFTPEEAALVKGSNDFYGMNHYCANYIRHKEGEPDINDFSGNLEVLFQNKDGEWVGPETQSPWLRPHPEGFRKLIKWLSDRYGGPTFYVTENGTSLKGESQLPLEELLNDEFRCEYFRGYIGALADAHAKDGVDVRGYSAWSLMEYVVTPPLSYLSYFLFSPNHVDFLALSCFHYSHFYPRRPFLSLASPSCISVSARWKPMFVLPTPLVLMSLRYTSHHAHHMSVSPGPLYAVPQTMLPSITDFEIITHNSTRAHFRHLPTTTKTKKEKPPYNGHMQGMQIMQIISLQNTPTPYLFGQVTNTNQTYRHTTSYLQPFPPSSTPLLSPTTVPHYRFSSTTQLLFFSRRWLLCIRLARVSPLLSFL